MSETKSRLAQVVLKALRLDKAPADLERCDLVRDMGVSSIDALEILINVEIEFGIEVADEDLSQTLVSSLDSLEAYVERQLALAG